MGRKHRNKASASTKEKIITRASERFFRDGLRGCPVDELTSELSMSKKTFYQVFKSKEDLVEQIIEQRLGEINLTMETILARPVDFVHKLHAVVSFMGEVIGGISKATFAELSSRYPHLWSRIEKFRRERLSKNITRLLEQGVPEGYIRPEVNPRVFLLVYLAAIENVMQASVLSQESFSSREALDAIMEIFFNGILTGSARTRYEDLQRTELSHS